MVHSFCKNPGTPLRVSECADDPISTTNLKNTMLALTTAIIYTNKQVAKKCNFSPIAKP